MHYQLDLPERERVTTGVCPDCGGRFFGTTMCRECLADHGSVAAILRTMGVLNDKHIPTAYLRAPETQRRELLAGLMDTGGSVSTSRHLPVRRGEQAPRRRRARAGGEPRLQVQPHDQAGEGARAGHRDPLHAQLLRLRHRLPSHHKQRMHKERRPATTARIGRRYITSVRRVPSVPVRCVQVDNTDQLYLAGRSMIPTHNSTLALDLCRAASIHNNLTSVFFSLEMTKLRDHDAAALGRGQGAAQPHPQRPAQRGRLDQAGPQDGRGLQRPGLHRRLAEHDHDGDPGQGAPAQAAPRPAADRHRLHAADDVGQEGRVPPARGLGVLPPDQAAGQGARGPDRRPLPAQPWP